MNITGKTMIFKSEYGYSTTLSSKSTNGEYEKMYIQVQMPKEANLENRTMIEIKKGFLTFYKTKDGLSKVKAVVIEYSTEEKEEDFKIEADDLPF